MVQTDGSVIAESLAKSRKPLTTNRNLRKRRRSLFPYLLLAPAVAMFLTVIAYPFVQSLLFGFFDESLLGDRSGEFVGFDNVWNLLSSPDFWSVAWQTIVFVVVSTVGALVLALALATALNSKI